MVDIRSEIVELAEECIHLLLEKKIDKGQVGEEWKQNLPAFVERNYPERKPNYLALKRFFENHKVEEFSLRDFDITALRSLIGYFSPLKEILRKDIGEDDYRSLESRIIDVCDVRNVMDHYTQKISEPNERRFAFDQMDSVSAIIRLSFYCEKMEIGEKCWKTIIDKAFYYQGMLRRERWFIAAKDEKYDVNSESDYSELVFAADSGDENAQLLLGKMHLKGTRYGLDKDKAYMWLYKAARKQKNPEAMYYLGECYRCGAGVEYDSNKGVEWIKRAADAGYAPAQYELGIRDWARTNLTCEERNKVTELMNLSAEQGYLPAIWNMGLNYEMGLGVERDLTKASHLQEKAALLGYKPACEHLAQEARRENDTESEKKWRDLAKKADIRKVWP